MTDRLDRVEAILLTVGERLDAVGERLDAVAVQQQRNTDEIDTLLGAVSTNEVEARNLLSAMAESNQRFDILRAEAIADRQKADRVQEEFSARFENLRQEAIADRQQVERDREEYRQRSEESNRRFEESNQRFEEKQAEDNQRFAAQQEVIQRLLAELVATNRDVQRVSDRVQNLEAG